MIEQYMRKYGWAQNKLKPLYLLVTQDRFELPLVVADTVEELARIVGVHTSTIVKCLNRGGKSRYVRVYVNMGEDDE